MERIFEIFKTDRDTALALLAHIHEVAKTWDDNDIEWLIFELKQNISFLESEIEQRNAPPRVPYVPTQEEIDLDKIPF